MYIGRTNDINKRMESGHFSKQGHLPRKCYMDTNRIEYAKFGTDATMRIYEIYLIGVNNPPYNHQFNHKKEEMDLLLVEPNWIEYKITRKMRASIKEEERGEYEVIRSDDKEQDDSMYDAEQDRYDIESWHMCFAALGGGL